MEKGKAEMEKQTGAETAYAKHTKRVLELILVEVEEEGVTQAYATDASAGEEGVGVGVWKGVGGTGTEEERVRWGARGCTCPPGWDNDDGELFGILWAVSMGYVSGRETGTRGGLNRGSDGTHGLMVDGTGSGGNMENGGGSGGSGKSARNDDRGDMLVQEEDEGDKRPLQRPSQRRWSQPRRIRWRRGRQKIR